MGGMGWAGVRGRGVRGVGLGMDGCVARGVCDLS